MKYKCKNKQDRKSFQILLMLACAYFPLQAMGFTDADRELFKQVGSGYVYGVDQSIKSGIGIETKTPQVSGYQRYSGFSLPSGDTPLLYAASKGKSDVVEFLIKKGALATATDD